MNIVQSSRDIQDRFFDSTIWKDFPFRPDDIIIATYGKSGTTWMQQIVSQLIFGGEDFLPVAEMSPWLDFRHPSAVEKLQLLEAQEHRRFIKTHLPADALTVSDEAKYIYVARDGRDVAWSWFNHHKASNQLMYDLLEYEGEKFPKPVEPIEEYFRKWLENDGEPWWSFWENINTWWKLRDKHNILFVHFYELKENLCGQIERIAEFLDIKIDDKILNTIVEHCGFDYMKKHCDQSVPFSGALWKEKVQSFIYKGTNRRWNDTLTSDDSINYYTKALENLDPECVLWLSQGNSPENIEILHTMVRELLSRQIKQSNNGLYNKLKSLVMEDCNRR